MKLRNRKTGEVGQIRVLACTLAVDTKDENNFYEYTSLAELNEEWEDYEEPKGYWVIEPYGKVEYIKIDRHWSEDLYYQFKDFGNCFDTQEEAEKAVEKLKAWKRLKDKGFEFDGWHPDVGIRFLLYNTELEKKSVKSDLDLLFGGEE